jgi:hypothetical protein
MNESQSFYYDGMVNNGDINERSYNLQRCNGRNAVSAVYVRTTEHDN